MNATPADIARAIIASLATEPDAWKIVDATGPKIFSNAIHIRDLPGDPLRIVHEKASIVIAVEQIGGELGVGLHGIDVPISDNDIQMLGASVQTWLLAQAVAAMLIPEPLKQKTLNADFSRIDAADYYITRGESYGFIKPIDPPNNGTS